MGRTRLTVNQDTYAWLIADDSIATYAAYNFADPLTPMTMETPAGTVKASGMGFGKVVFRTRGTPALEVWAVQREGPITFPVLPDARATLNGKDVTDRLVRQTLEGVSVFSLP